jgi:TPR repeat protein
MTRVERPASRSVRLVASAAIGAALFILPSVSPAQMPGATPFGQQDPVARDAVVNLKAYAEYKMGHYDNAREIWEGLAASGNTTALINLSNLFSQGGGVTADQKKAYGYTLKAAELGDPRAQHDVGLEYEKGGLVPRDIDTAAAWLKKSADQDYADGQFAYGVLLATGRGKGLDQASEADKAEAIAQLKKAQAGGNGEAGDYIKTLSGVKG